MNELIGKYRNVITLFTTYVYIYTKCDKFIAKASLKIIKQRVKSKSNLNLNLNPVYCACGLNISKRESKSEAFKQFSSKIAGSKILVTVGLEDIFGCTDISAECGQK